MEEKYWDGEKIDTGLYKNFCMNSSLAISSFGMVLVRKAFAAWIPELHKRHNINI